MQYVMTKMTKTLVYEVLLNNNPECEIHKFMSFELK